MTETQAASRERSLTWIAREFYYVGGVEMARQLRSGARLEREAVIAKMEDRASAARTGTPATRSSTAPCVRSTASTACR